MNKLINWYREQCNGNWEHQYGFTIETTDNPGIWLQIDLLDTGIDLTSREVYSENNSDTDWIVASVKDCKFDGACSLQNLDKLIGIFFSKAIG